ncbi:MAG: ATP synthase F0 subunit C [Gemmatimonadetes bacterium]|nr:ATP synthase F0 subunit C [Gemmatimonadota bacterium]
MLHALVSAVQEVGGAIDPVAAKNYGSMVGSGLSIGLVVIGVGLGIGRIGGSAAEGIARQPEAAGTIQAASIIFAALIEGVALFGLVITILYM